MVQRHQDARRGGNSLGVTQCGPDLPGGGPDYAARLAAAWHTGYLPTEADATLLEVLADHATAVVHRERTTARLGDTVPIAQSDIDSLYARYQNVYGQTITEDRS